MPLKPAARPDPAALYRALRRAPSAELAAGAPTGRGTKYVAYSRGCGGGPSFLVREEGPDGAARAYVILATTAPGGVEESSFASPAEALAFVAEAVAALRPTRFGFMRRRA